MGNALVEACLERHTMECLIDAFVSPKSSTKTRRLIFRAFFEGDETAMTVTPLIRLDLQDLSVALCTCKMAPGLPDVNIRGRRA